MHGLVVGLGRPGREADAEPAPGEMVECDQSRSERSRAAHHQERRGGHQGDRPGARGSGSQRNQTVSPGNGEEDVVVGAQGRVAEGLRGFGAPDQGGGGRPLTPKARDR